MPIWAHSRNVAGKRHLLVDHLRGTAELARRFGEPFGAGNFCYSAGLAHDLGKVTARWQEYLDHRERNVATARVNHKSPGADLVGRVAGEYGRLIVEGHHTAIPNCGERGADRDPIVEAEVESAVREMMPDVAVLLDGPSVIPPRWVTWLRSEPTSLEMAIRLAHSALVDADFLDTAAHFNNTSPKIRPQADFTVLQDQFDESLAALLAGRASSPVDGLRAALLDDCRTAAKRAQGIFRLPAPTGSGKTIAAAAFALGHAAAHGMSRVIVAVPFLTITEQNAAVYRQLLGDQNVIEHHSGVALDRDDKGGSQRSKLGVENWDAPFVVTTTVQLFESLFSNRPSKTRKLHRLVNSVILLDEIQAIPPALLPVILDGLRILLEHFGATVVLSSATQPTWDLVGAWRNAAKLDVVDIVGRPGELYAGMRRSTVEWEHFASLETVADALSDEAQALAVVNTTADARNLARLVRDRTPEGTYHLSTRMYPRHRRDVLAKVRERLASGLPVRLVSTQLVEAGVDLDFPTVFRAKAPGDNLSQARGRCNREGRRQSGRFVIFDCPGLGDLKDYRLGIAVAVQHFKESTRDLDDPGLMREYYDDLYRSLRVDDDPFAKTIQKARVGWYFQDAAAFTMISNDGEPVVVTHESSDVDDLVADLSSAMLAGAAPTVNQFRRLQDYTINLRSDLIKQAGASVVEKIPGIKMWCGPYDPMTGVSIDSGLPNDSVY